MPQPGLASDDKFEDAFIASFNGFSVTVGGEANHPRAANLHAAYFGFKELGIEVPEELLQAHEQKKDLDPIEALDLARKCSLLFVPYWCEGSSDAYLYYGLSRPVKITDLSPASIRHIRTWMESGIEDFVNIPSDENLIISTHLNKASDIKYFDPVSSSISSSLDSLENLIKHLLNRKVTDFESLEILNQNIRIDFKDTNFHNPPLGKELLQLALTALGAVLVREVLIADLNETFGWKINDSLKDLILYDQNLSFPEFLVEGSIGYYLVPHKALQNVFKEHNVPKDKHWELIRYAAKRRVEDAVKRIKEEYPTEVNQPQCLVEKKQESFLELYWEKAHLENDMQLSQAKKSLEQISYWLTKQSKGSNVKLHGVFKALFQEGRFEEESKNAILYLLRSNEGNCLEAYRNLQQVLDIHAHPHYLLSKNETEEYIAQLNSTQNGRNVDGILKARLNHANVLKRDGAEDALINYFQKFISDNSGQVVLEGDWEEVPLMLMKTYAAASIKLSDLKDIIFEVIFDGFAQGIPISSEILFEKLQKVLELENTQKELSTSQASEVERSKVHFYEISNNGNSIGLFSEWLNEQGTNVARRITSLVELNQLIVNSVSTSSRLIHSKPLRQPGMWELCSYGAVRVVYCRTKDGDIVLLGGVDKKGRDWLQDKLIEKCRTLKDRLDAGDESLHLIKI